jgi:predicted lipoprotein with Yx(FWY)xxD motif
MKIMKSQQSTSFFVLLALITVLTGSFGCSKSDDNPSPAGVLKVKLAPSSTLGQYLVDKDGVALYFFSNDYKGINSCSGGCAGYWPYFYAGNLTQDSLGAGLKLADFDTIMVSGHAQTRYKGWPLYYYAPAGNGVIEASGLTSGEAVNSVWYVAKPDYTIMLANGQLVGHDGKNYTSSYAEGAGKTLYFTDAQGLTLYTFVVDSSNINKFTKADFSNNAVWPIYDTINVVVPSILDKTKFSSTTVAGHKQLTYNGWPLYYFGQDSKIRGNNKGVSFPVPGKWPVAVKNISPAPHK